MCQRPSPPSPPPPPSIAPYYSARTQCASVWKTTTATKASCQHSTRLPRNVPSGYIVPPLCSDNGGTIAGMPATQPKERKSIAQSGGAVDNDTTKPCRELPATIMAGGPCGLAQELKMNQTADCILSAVALIPASATGPANRPKLNFRLRVRPTGTK